MLYFKINPCLNKIAISSVFILLPEAVLANSITDESVRQQHRLQELQKQIVPEHDVRLQKEEVFPSSSLKNLIPESPCYNIDLVQLTGASHFFSFLKQSLKTVEFKAGMCLGVNGVQLIAEEFQNTLIARGYATTIVKIPEQDLSQGVLLLEVVPGKVQNIRVETDKQQQTHSERIVAFQNEFPTQAGEVLNLRDLEHGLENLRRISSAQSNIQIIPSEQSNSSDVLIQWQQSQLPISLMSTLDNSGSKDTGQIQSSSTVKLENPFGFSDIFYINHNRDIAGYRRMTDAAGKRVHGSSGGYAMHYSVPIKKWLLAFNHNRSEYTQIIPVNGIGYDYQGKSVNTSIDATRMLYRDGKRKTSMNLGVWSRENHSIFADVALDAQAKNNAGWTIGLQHKEQFESANLDLNLKYKRGTGMYGAKAAVEEAVGEGTSRMKVWAFSADYTRPFVFAEKPAYFNSFLHIQKSQTKLLSQDQLHIGGPYSVRGFDGQTNLSGDNGWYWRNELGWSYLPAHQIYVGLDVGHVSGSRAHSEHSQSLVGSTIGIKGQASWAGTWLYGASYGRVLHQPQNFQAGKKHFGFSLTYLL